MAYESLYRRYRPQRFSEVRGQAHVVAALHNAVRENRVGHAYLLSGPRGTGKTTTARILAKALNCTDLDDGEPCGACDSCRAIEAGTSYDLQELDAASNNGVDAMRDLIAKAALGSPGRTKVYLLDEVHMLSVGASNALLKTLEEPPGHVVFVLATTDPHKVLPTIRSRTQHFELHLLPAEELRSLVDDVIADAGLDVDAEGIEYALRAGGGSARDTLSALDQVVAAGGVLDRGDQVEDLVDALAANDTGASLRAVSEAVGRGHDPRVVGEALLARMRDVFLHRMGDPLEHVSVPERTRAAGWAEHFSDRDCTRALEEIGDALRAMRSAPDTRIPLELALVRLTRADTDLSPERLAARIDQLERGTRPDPSGPSPSTVPPAGSQAPTSSPADAARAALGDRPARAETPPPVPAEAPPTPATSGSPAAPNPPAVPTPPPRIPPGAAAPPPTRAEGPTDATPAPAATPEPSSGALSLGRLTEIWTTRVLPNLSGLTKAMYSVGHFVDTDGTTARFAVPNDVHRQKSLQKVGEVEAAVANHLGRPLGLELIVEGSATPPVVDARDDAGSARERTSRAGRAEAEPAPDERDEIGPIDELTDAPSDDRNATQRIVDAFPGAEIVDG